MLESTGLIPQVILKFRLLQVSSGVSAWTAHLLVLKLVLWLLGVPSAVPFLEALCYTGYPLVLVCINTVVVFLFGKHVDVAIPAAVSAVCTFKA